MAKEFFEGTDIPWAIFHTFRREAGSVPLKQQDDGPETKNQDDELDETLTGMDYIPYTQQNLSLIHISDCMDIGGNSSLEE